MPKSNVQHNSTCRIEKLATQFLTKNVELTPKRERQRERERESDKKEKKKK
jgi:hypothetical protein